jgi:uncharacterized protein YyaL (SSP411 family)
MTNHLAGQTSPYLLQHADNPVDWYPWGDEALNRARSEHKPIFLSIGYAACHWCHVMAHESFEDPATAALMNENFVSIKVDREERPDLDGIYMAATQALTGSGGWPMSVFLTPDLKPFYAGTYFPPEPRYNMPSFKDVLASLAEAWKKQPEEVERVSGKVVEHLKAANAPNAAGQRLAQHELESITKGLLDGYDWGYGGWGNAPKFPQPMLIEFLLRRAVEKRAGGEDALRAALHALKAMARGGMYDVVGGGFARYSTDNFWRVPHFEKMLYDNAQLARAYLHAWQMTRDAFYKHILVETLDFVQREMTDAEGGFYSSLDADSEGEEGKYYVWTRDEIRNALKDDADFDLFSAAYGVTERGNWEGRIVLQRALDDESLAARFKMMPDEVRAVLDRSHRLLLAKREQRVRPGTDDKVLVAWNGLMLEAVAEAARFLDEPDLKQRYLDMAQRNAAFLLDRTRVGGKLRRAYRAGRGGSIAFLEDHAALIYGLLALYQADFDNRWFAAARELADEMIADFADAEGGFFDTPASGEPLLLRPKEMQDNATPSGNALACEALLRLASLTGRGEYRDRAEAGIAQAADTIRRFPTAFGRWLNAADYALSSAKQVAILYPDGQTALRPLLDVVDAAYRPNIVLAASQEPPPADAPALLADRPLLDGRATAYVCQDFVCKLPVNSPEALKEQLQT